MKISDLLRRGVDEPDIPSDINAKLTVDAASHERIPKELDAEVSKPRITIAKVAGFIEWSHVLLIFILARTNGFKHKITSSIIQFLFKPYVFTFARKLWNRLLWNRFVLRLCKKRHKIQITLQNTKETNRRNFLVYGGKGTKCVIHGVVGLYATSGFEKVSGKFTLCLIIPELDMSSEEGHDIWENYKKALQKVESPKVVAEAWQLHLYDSMSTHWKKRGKRTEEQISYHLFDFMQFYGSNWFYYWDGWRFPDIFQWFLLHFCPDTYPNWYFLMESCCIHREKDSIAYIILLKYDILSNVCFCYQHFLSRHFWSILAKSSRDLHFIMWVSSKFHLDFVASCITKHAIFQISAMAFSIRAFSKDSWRYIRARGLSEMKSIILCSRTV